MRPRIVFGRSFGVGFGAVFARDFGLALAPSSVAASA